MATATDKNRCAICGKEKATLRCGGCSKDFCFSHVADHRQELSKQLDEVEVTRDLFRQTLTEQTSQQRKHPLIQQIDKWERDSINKIRQVAEEARQLLFRHTTGDIEQIEVYLNKLTDQLRQSRQEDDFFETDLSRWKIELARLTEALNKPSNISVRQDSTPLITKISVDVQTAYIHALNTRDKARWIQKGITVAGGNGQGNGVNQLSHPFSVYVDDDQSIYIVDCSNHRIVEWKNGATSGQVVAGENGQGNRMNQLDSPSDVIVDTEKDCLIICDRVNRRVVRWPRRNGTIGQIIISDVDCSRLAMDNNGYLYVSDYKKHEVRRWRMGDTNGTVVAGGIGIGNRLNQLNNPAYIFVDQNHSVYVSDTNNNRVMKWMKDAKEGTIVAGGHGDGNDLSQLYSPCGVVVDQLGTIYVVDCGNNRLMRWSKGAIQGDIVAGENKESTQQNQFEHPMGLSFDRQGNLYVADTSNHRIQKFNIDPSSNA